MLISDYFKGVVWLQSTPSHVFPSWSWWVGFWDYSLGWNCWSSLQTSWESYQTWKGENLGGTLSNGCESILAVIEHVEDPVAEISLQLRTVGFAFQDCCSWPFTTECLPQSAFTDTQGWSYCATSDPYCWDPSEKEKTETLQALGPLPSDPPNNMDCLPIGAPFQIASYGQQNWSWDFVEKWAFKVLGWIPFKWPWTSNESWRASKGVHHTAVRPWWRRPW